MILYHGTSESCAREILKKEAILPRSITGQPNRWNSFPSAPNLVYLTDAYAGYFAATASSKKERWAVIEIDVSKLDVYSLLPDEDFLEQITRQVDVSGDHFEELRQCGSCVDRRTRWFRDNLYDFRHLTGSSIDGLGNCAYHGKVPLAAINRIVLVDPRIHSDMCQLALDPSITVANYAVCGKKYRALTKWMCLRSIKVTDLFSEFSLAMPELVPGSNEKILRDWKRKQDEIELNSRSSLGRSFLWDIRFEGWELT